MSQMMGTRTPAQMFALVFGVVYLLIGVLGFAVTGFDNFAAEQGDKLLLFPVNPLHNIVHLALGAVWLGAAGSHAAAKSVNMLFGIVLLLVFVLGMASVLKFLAIEDAASSDNYLHLATAALSLYFGSIGAEGARPTEG